MTSLGATASTTTFPATASDVGADASGAAATAASGAASALAAHEADTTAIHGIANTANLYIAGGTDVAVADGGTGSSTAGGARTNLGLVIGTDVQAQGAYAPGGTDVAVADGGTGSSTALAARAALGAGSAVILRYPPTGALYHNFDREENAGNLGLLNTGRLSIVMIEMDTGVTLTSITFVSGTTALTVGVNQWFALFDSSRALLRVTADDTSVAWAANTSKTLNLSSTFVTTYSGTYFLGIMVKATTVPSLIAATSNSTLAAVVLPFHGGNSTTGLTNPASCPNPAGAIAGGVGFPYAWVS